MKVCFISTQQPRSVQAEHVSQYKKRLKQEFEDFKYLFPDIPIDENIYSKLVYIHTKPSGLDVDNISKPFVDTFKGILYPDDNIINHRICSKIRFDEFESYEFQLDLLPIDVSEKLDDLISKKSPHIVYFEIGLFSPKMISFGGVKDEA